jgi:hypothetical protein
MTTDTQRPERPGEPSLAAPHFEARLWQELERLHEQRQHPVAPVGAVRRRRSRSLRLGIGLVAAAAAVAGVLVVRDPGSGSGSGGRDPDSRAASPGTRAEPPVSLETRIVNATGAAIDASVVKVTTVDGSGRSGDDVDWTDEQSGRMRMLQLNLAGEHSFDSGPATAPGLDTPSPDFPDRPDIQPTDPDVPQVLERTVDYCFGQYRDGTNFALPGYSFAGMIRDDIERGHLHADGTEMYEGRELLRFEYETITYDDSDLLGVSVPTYTPEPRWVLVDPETYRPVYQADPDIDRMSTIEYLPRTAENLALLQPPVPAGFEKVDELRGDGERADAGCGP